MKLYMIIYVAGLIGGTVGPLPYGMDECERRVGGMKDGADRSVISPEGYTADDIHFVCEWHTVRPGNDPRAGKPREPR